MNTPNKIFRIIICFLLPVFQNQVSDAQTTLRLVMPQEYAAAPLKQMFLKWDSVNNAQAYAWRYKAGAGGAYSAWDSLTDTDNKHWESTIAYDNNTTYYFQIRVRVGGAWSAASNADSNSFIDKIWPVSNGNGNCNTESVEILHGYQQWLHIGKDYMHEGVDIQGPGNLSGECVKAPEGGRGITKANPPNGHDKAVVIEVLNDGNSYLVQWNHTTDHDAAYLVNGTVRPKQRMADIDSVPNTSWTTIMQHAHMHYYDFGGYANTMNPFTYFGKPEHRDPQNKAPEVYNTNGDDDAIRFRKGPHKTDYFPKDTVHNEVDVVAEVIDRQSSDDPYHIPKYIGYFIEKKNDNTWQNAVKSSGSPFVFLDHVNSYMTADIKTLPFIQSHIMDVSVAKANRATGYGGKDPGVTQWYQRFTYIITNTKGTDGLWTSLDSNQCFATDARSNVATDNGYANNYDRARCVEEAKFGDGVYRLGIILKDFVNTAPTHYREFTVDNFRPYTKKISMKVGADEIYKADWEWNNGSGTLKFNKNTLPAKAKCDKDLIVIIEMSEPMTNVSLFIPSIGFMHTEVTPEANTNRKTFKFTIPADKVAKGGDASPVGMVIMGKDMAGNELMGFQSESDVPAANIHRRKIDGTWLPATPPLPDVLHKFKVDSVAFRFAVEDASCDDKADGKINLTVTKGEAPFTYLWSNNATSQNLNGVKAGTYSVRVTDKNKCEAERDTVVDTKYDVEVSVTGGGSYTRACDRVLEITLSASASGGEAPYTYNWPNGTLTLFHSGPNPKAGFYTANVTDKNGCKGKRTTYVFSIPVRCSYDPNDIIGPPGFGDQKFVARTATLPYKIRFENDPKFATAPASRVTVDLPIDVNLDMNSFRLSSFGFNNWKFDIPNNMISYSTRLDLRDTIGVYVDVIAGIDQAEKKAFWIFESIDPATGLPPTSGSLGFLPVNDTSIKNGEGFVDFIIKPKQNTTTGDSLRAIAEIVFDDNPSIFTPKIHNIVDAFPPVSKLDSLPATTDSVSFNLRVTASDDTGGSGVESVDLLVSENNGTWFVYAKNIVDSIIAFSGNEGSQYRFYSVATDNVGNREANKNIPDAVTSITPSNFLTSPDSGFTICAGDTMNIRWKRTAITAFNLEVSTDKLNYTSIATGLSGLDTVHQWLIEDTFNTETQIWMRAVASNSSSVIDTAGPFTIQPTPEVILGNDTFFCDGSAFSILLDAGSGFSSYLWTDSSTAQTLSVSSEGTYGVTVSNSFGCNASDDITVTRNLLPSVLSKTVTHIACHGETNGSIDLAAAGGTQPYSYLWSNADTTEDISGLAAGTFVVSINDSFGCSVSDTTVITEPAKLILSANITPVKCKNGNDGNIDISVTGGTTPYTYLWSNSSTSQDIGTLTAGEYSLTVTDARSCAALDTFDVTEPDLLTSTIASVHVACFNGSSGSADLTVSGGTAPYTYLWNNSATSQDITNLTAGTYTVVITDVNNCTLSDTVVITEPTLFSFTKSVQHVKCKNGNDGSIDITYSGGTTPYNYLWSNSTTTEDLSSLTAGTYSVTATDGNGCSVFDTTVVNEPALLTLTKTFVVVKCKNGNNGSIDLTVSGGTSPYTYLWSNSATSQDISTLTAGTYSVVITDANSCTLRDTTVITEPALLTTSKSVVHVKCNSGSDGSIDLSVSGGTSPYTYLWSNSASTQDINSLSAGTYSVTVTDNNACLHLDTTMITEPAVLSHSKSITHVSCKHGSNGSIDLSISGGTTPYTYLWSNSATTQDISGLVAGTYSVLITDANACTRRDTITITEPALLTHSKTSQNVKCKNGNDGSIDLTVAGGTTPYTYLWSNSATTQDISTLSAGTYTVRITDANSCTLRDTIMITEPPLLSRSKTVLHVSCKNGNNGSIDLTISGGVSPYSYLWSNSATTQDLNSLTAGTYSIVITDANACILRDTSVITEPALLVSSKTVQHVSCKNGNNGSIDLTVSGGVSPYTYLWSNSATTQDISGLVAGTYSVLITDANACTRRDTITITEPALLTRSTTSIDVKCFGDNSGSIDLTVSGGTTPYSYLWSNSATTQDISGLAAGTYTVRVTDAKSCVVRDTVTISQPTLLTVNKSFSTVKCFGGNDGSIDLTVSGGTTPYSYLWSNTATTQDLSNLMAGTYSVRVTDGNGCIRRDTTVITEPAVLAASHSIVHVSCKNGSNASIDLSISGGTTPYSYLWSNNATTQDISGLSAGRYTVVTTDGNGCFRRDTMDVTEPPLLTSSIVMSPVLCFGGSSGSLNLSVTGGTQPYSFIWSNSSLTEDIAGLIAASYQVLIRDAQNCILRDTAEVTQPNLLEGLATVDDVNCKNGSDGSINFTPSGGVLPYNFLWSNASANEDLNNLKVGTYRLLLTDANSCTYRDTFTVAEPTLLEAGFTINDVLCHQGNDGSISAQGIGGVSPYNYQWSSGENQALISSKTAGTYIVTITDQNACSRKDTLNISEPQFPLSLTEMIDAVNCYGGSDGNVDITVSGGTMPYTYNWSNGSSGEDLNNETQGFFDVLITDKNNCTLRDTFEILQPLAPLSSALLIDDVKCFGDNSGNVDLGVSGGTLPYTYLWSNAANTEDLSNVVSGTYTVDITDANNCTWKDTAVVGQPTAPLTTVLNGSNINCFGGSDGAIVNMVSGGTIPYTYQWTNAATGKDLSGLTAGFYRVDITDNNTCTYTDSITLTQPNAPLSAVLDVDPVKCFGENSGNITLTPSGGTPGYTYDWNNGSSAQQNLNNINMGWYHITITDKNSCTYDDSAFVPEPTELLITATAYSATPAANNGSAVVQISGGTRPYMILWDDGHAQTTDSATHLGVGIYQVTVTDSNGCMKSATVEVPDAPDPSTISLFPNPSRGSVSIINLSSLGLDEEIKIEIYDMSGKMVMETTVIGQDTYIFNLYDSLSNGSYFVRVKNSRGLENRRLIVIR